jgi:hypothetical protein
MKTSDTVSSVFHGVSRQQRDQISQQTSNSDQQFVERYCVLSPILSEGFDESTTKVNVRLKRMGFLWK